MPSIGRSVVSPFNPQNLVLPSRISVWFAPFDAQGRQSEYFELGDVSDIEINIAETFAEKKSARQGTFQTIKRLINDLVGEVTMNLSEVVGRNLELLFRPAQVLLRDGVANALSVWHESTRPRLIGTTPSEVAPGIAQERVDGGALNEVDLTLISVTNVAGNVTYIDTVDYTFTQAVQGVFDFATLTFATFTAAAGNTLTLTEDDGTLTVITSGTEVETGAAAGSTTALAAAYAEAINAYSSSYHATSAAAVLTINHNSLSFAAPASVTVTGAALIADVGAGPFAFGGFVATAAATIERIADGAIPNGAEVKVTFTFEREAVEYQLQSGQVLEGAMKLQILSTSGPQGFYEFYRVNLEIGGNITVNPQEFMMAPLKATILTGGDGRRGRFVQACNFSDFFVQSNATSCSAVA
jgi:hypothetical protein